MGSNDEKLFNVSFTHRIIASSVGGIMTAFVMTPLDVVKIRMQSPKTYSENKCLVYCNGLAERLSTCSLSCNTCSVSWSERAMKYAGRWNLSTSNETHCCSTCIPHYNNPYFVSFSRRSPSVSDTVFKIIRNEGILSLWSGLSPTLVMTLPQTVIYFTVNDWLKYHVGYTSKTINKSPVMTSESSQKFISPKDFLPPLVGGVSRIFAVMAVSPIELLRTKIQARKVLYRDIAALVVTTVRQDGLKSLWLGAGPTLLRDVPYSMVFWLTYDYMKSGFINKQIKTNLLSNSELPANFDRIHFSHTFGFGAVAGFISGVLTHPFDVIKTHRQVDFGKHSFAFNHLHPTSTWTSLHNLYIKNGLPALFSGFTPRLIKTTIASAIMIAVFESLKEKVVNIGSS
ncbi:unnamed protein product [Schistosoma rodhaini]|uniref:Mitochondrial carrier protein n=2 Tax=Schistosoma rodhaini TaxID=6188 RepID=A0AA85G1B9_9TREM|nr:unnamed protein product [Schistosoma rodhaini]CAH8601444.1 unnamed protein product [Schistosoma rodhaini]